MTQDQKTELEYLIDLLREASKWNTDPGDDALRLEVDLRINNILNGETQTDAEPDNLPAESEALTNEDFKALEAIRLNEHLASPEKVEKAKERWKADKVRCQENGKVVWRKKCECIQQPRDNSHGGPAWMWKWIGPQDKKAQEDAMWAEHEISNKE